MSVPVGARPVPLTRASAVVCPAREAVVVLAALVIAAGRFVGDAAEVLLVVALGGMLWAAVSRLRHGRVHLVRCRSCGRPASRAYPRCPHCEAPR